MKRTCLKFMLFFSFFGPVAQAQLYFLPFEQIINQSELIVEGQVIGKYSFFDNQNDHIYTANEVEVFKLFKGDLGSSSKITVITRGGIVGLRAEFVSELAQFSDGDLGLFCLKKTNLPISIAEPWENYGSAHGFFAYDTHAGLATNPFHVFEGIETAFYQSVKGQTKRSPITVNRKELSERPMTAERLAPTITTFSPTTISAGTNSILTISGAGFGATKGTVNMRNADDGGGSFIPVDASDILTWTDATITVNVPSTTGAFSEPVGTGQIQVVTSTNESVTSGATLTVNYAYSNIVSGGIKYGATLVDDDGAGGLTFTLSTSICGANQDAVNAVGRTIKAWRCANGVNFKLSPSTTASTAISGDGVNIITFDVSLPIGALGVAYSYYSGCFAGSLLKWYVTEVDVNIDDATNWYYCDSPTGIDFTEYDFQSVMFHELGHAHQLGHVILSSAVMHYAIANSQVKRVLSGGEAAGANYIIGLPANGCGPTPMTLATAGNCNAVSAPAACSGSTPCTAALPVELTYFGSKQTGDGVLTQWRTASEVNSDYFIVQRATNGFQFEDLATKKAAGNSVQSLNYQFVDQEPREGLNYYRLAQVDLDGRVVHSKISQVVFNKKTTDLQATILPNPIHDGLIHFQLFSENETNFTVEVFDLMGRLILAKSFETGQGWGDFQLRTEGLPTGQFLLSLKNGKGARVVKFQN